LEAFSPRSRSTSDISVTIVTFTEVAWIPKRNSLGVQQSDFCAGVTADKTLQSAVRFH